MSGTLAFIRALTSLHAGAGSGIGAIDLPIQREKHTGWPMIQGAGVKGVFRDRARETVAQTQTNGDREMADTDTELKRVFGPPVGDAAEFGGALAVSDARILLFPVRSIKGVFALATCKGVLERLTVDCTLAGVTPPALPTVWPSDPNTAQALAAQPDLLFFAVNDHQQALLEDIAVSLLADGDVSALASWLADYAPAATERLVIVPDDVFNYFVRFHTEVITRNRLDYNTKTVESGALFSEEFLPPETVLYSVLLVERPYDRSQTNGAAILDRARDWLHDKAMQFGGDASVGKGICHVKLADAAPGGGGND